MEKKLSLKAYAKVNLQLDVTGKREDGYHILAGVMQRISICDEIELAVRPSESSGVSVVFDEPVPFKNTVRTAAERFLSGAPYEIIIEVKKHIPSEAGLGGASADAAAVLKGLNELFAGTALERGEEELYSLGLSIGADVPFCLMGGCAVAKGVGEELFPLPFMPMTFVILKGREGVSTPALFKLFDETEGTDKGPRLPEGSLKNMAEAIKNGDKNAVAANMKNALQPAAESIVPEIKRLCSMLARFGALGACMTGSGAAVVGLFEDEKKAERLINKLEAQKEQGLYFALCGAVK